MFATRGQQVGDGAEQLRRGTPRRPVEVELLEVRAAFLVRLRDQWLGVEHSNATDVAGTRREGEPRNAWPSFITEVLSKT
jgi:hypothetical protein